MSVISQATWPKAFQSRNRQMQINPKKAASPVRKNTSGGLPKVVSAQRGRRRPNTIASQTKENGVLVKRRRVPPNNITIRLMVNHAPARNNARASWEASPNVEMCQYQRTHGDGDPEQQRGNPPNNKYPYPVSPDKRTS